MKEIIITEDGQVFDSADRTRPINLAPGDNVELNFGNGMICTFTYGSLPNIAEARWAVERVKLFKHLFGNLYWKRGGTQI